MNIHLYGQYVLSLVDTGASTNCVSEEFLEELVKNKKVFRKNILTHQKVSLCVANGQVIQVQKAVILHIKLGFLSWNVKFWVVPHMRYPIVLGLEFLSDTRAIVNLDKGYLSFGFNEKVRVGLNVSECQEQLFQVGEGSEIEGQEKTLVEKLVTEFSDVITNRIGSCDLLPYKFRLTDYEPVKCKPYPCSPPRLKILREIIDKLLESGVIVPSNSDYCSPCFLVKKKESDRLRLVVNHSEVSKKIHLDPFPLPTVDGALQFLGKAKYFSVIDLNLSFHQCALDKSCWKYTSFSTPWQQYEFTRIPMGANFGSQALSRVLDKILTEYKFQFVLNYVDDIIVYSEDLETHVKHLRLVLQKLREAGLTVNPTKIKFLQKQVSFLGYIISHGELLLNPKKIEPVVKYPTPKNLKGVQRFLGMVGYYGRFIPNLSLTSSPLNKLKKKNEPFVWGEDQEKAFQVLKKALTEPPVLVLPDFDKPFTLQVDASGTALGAVLSQKCGDYLRPVAYASKALTTQEQGRSTYEKELMAVLFGIRKFESYLELGNFTLQTDNQALSWVLRHPNHVGKLGRWALFLSRFKFTVEHIKGSENAVADALSRMYDPDGCVGMVSGPEPALMLLQNMPEFFTSATEAQGDDALCLEIKENLKQKIPCPYVLENNLLYFTGKNGKARKVVVPEKFRKMVLKYYHDSFIGCHLGINKTFHKIAQLFAWPELKKDVTAYVRSCPLCQSSKPAQRNTIGFAGTKIADGPWSVVHIDIFGPLVRSRSGNSCILILIDCFTKFVFLLPLRNMLSKSIVKVLQTQIWKFFGSPSILVSDNAKYFGSVLFKNMCFDWAIRHVNTSAYMPQSNQVERFNRNLKACLTCFHYKDHTKWDEGLHFINIGFNNALHESTGCSPAEGFIGRELTHPLLNVWGIPSIVDSDPRLNYHALLDRVKINLESARVKVSARYDANRVNNSFQVGDLVLCRNYELPSAADYVSSKLTLKYIGPFIISKFIGTNTVSLIHPTNNKLFRKAHLSQLKNFNPR